MVLPLQDCIINDTFVNANEPQKVRLKYCHENCGYKCLNGEKYKKRDNGQHAERLLIFTNWFEKKFINNSYRLFTQFFLGIINQTTYNKIYHNLYHFLEQFTEYIQERDRRELVNKQRDVKKILCRN